MRCGWMEKTIYLVCTRISNIVGGAKACPTDHSHLLDLYIQHYYPTPCVSLACLWLHCVFLASRLSLAFVAPILTILGKRYCSENSTGKGVLNGTRNEIGSR